MKDGDGTEDGTSLRLVGVGVGSLRRCDRDLDLKDRPDLDTEGLGRSRRNRHRRPARAHLASTGFRHARRLGQFGHRLRPGLVDRLEADSGPRREGERRYVMGRTSGQCRPGDDEEPRHERKERPRQTPIERPRIADLIEPPDPLHSAPAFQRPEKSAKAYAIEIISCEVTASENLLEPNSMSNRLLSRRERQSNAFRTY